MTRRLFSRWTSVACAALMIVAPATGAGAAGFQSLYSFTAGNDGGNPATALAFDGAGNAYGTTVIGGLYGCGTVFELSPSQGGRWHETVLYNFSCFADGKNPHGGVTLDHSGNIYGTTVAGGTGGICASDGCGVVFELTPAGERVLYNFRGGDDGFGPGGGVVFDPAGNLYGTTPDGGSFSAGTVYELSREAGLWRERIIHNFTGGKDGAVGSLGLLLRDSGGNLYGVAELGGALNAGTAYKLAPSPGLNWTFTTLYAFGSPSDAASPYGGLISDASGNLYGTTYYGGTKGVGTVFELSPKGSTWSEHVLYSFKGGTDGSLPTSTLIFDRAGNLFGTSSTGGHPSCDCGTVFRLAHGPWTETITHRFSGGGDGEFPYYGLTPDASGKLYAATVAGGAFGQGEIFRFTP